MANVQPSWANKFRTRLAQAVNSFFNRHNFVAAYSAQNDTQNVSYIGNICNLMPKGITTATSTHSTPILAPDKDGVYRSYGVDNPVWGGTSVDLDPDQLFWGDLTITNTTPASLINFTATFNDVSTHRRKYVNEDLSYYIGDLINSGVSATYRPADGTKIEVYLGSNINLTRFYCYGNELTGSIPDLGSNINLTRFYCYGNQLTGSIPDISANTNLTRFYCYGNQLTGSIPDISANISLIYFYCHINQLTGSIPELAANVNLERFYSNTNQLTGSIPDISANTNLTHFYCHGNQLTGSIPNLSANTNLIHFYSNTNQLTDFLGGWPAKSFSFNASDNALTETAVNFILTEADTYGIPAGTVVDLTGGTNAVPTGLGITAKNNLIANGATVTTN